MKKENKTVLVTGAASGIGQAITEFLSEKGETVIATDFIAEGLKKYDKRKNILPVLMDVKSSDSISEAFKKIESSCDGLDTLVNNAGIFVGGPLVEIDIKDIERIMDINVLGYARVTKAFFPLLKHRKGKIINISSEVARISFPFNGPYSMSKYAIEAFSDALRRELVNFGIKVVIIQPGGMRTGFIDVTKNVYQKYSDDSDFQDIFTRLIPVLEKEKYADPKFLAKKIYKIIHENKPKIRYRVKNNKQRRMLEFLPASWADFLIKNLM
ncbi:MAG: SDR family oxidoreductase [Candidatus Heimdallarchaeaceae archaeon]|jgi:NAD(P)-dependent dehydrogenase (short-subunit alcohol dehydrogenase family)